MLLRVSFIIHEIYLGVPMLTTALEFAMLHDDEVIPKYAGHIVIGRVKGQTPSLEL